MNMAASSVQHIAVAGATGNVGKPLVDTLIKAGFQVTILTRSASTSSSHSGLSVRQVDYSSRQSIVDGLKGVQGVVSLLSGPGLAHQPGLVDAAVEAGVTRFLPSEFGSDTRHPGVAKFPVFTSKVTSLDYVEQKAADNPSFTYTALLTGPFLDFGLEHGLIADPKNRKAIIVNGGDLKFSTTPIPEVAKAITGVFKNLEGTRNKLIYVQSLLLTQNQIVKIGEKLTGTKWEIENVNSKDLEASAWEELKKPKPDPRAFAYPFLRSAIFGGDYGADYSEKAENDLVGLKPLSESDLEAEVKHYL